MVDSAGTVAGCSLFARKRGADRGEKAVEVVVSLVGVGVPVLSLFCLITTLYCFRKVIN